MENAADHSTQTQGQKPKTQAHGQQQTTQDDDQQPAAQTHGQQQKRNSRSTNLFPPLGLLNGAGQRGTTSIWANYPLTDTLGPREKTAGVPGALKTWDPEGAKSAQSTAPGQPLHSAPRPNGIGPDASGWPSGLASWPPQDNVQSRPNPSRSTSPPSAFQSTANTSPSFNPGRLTNGQSSTFPTSLAATPGSLASRGSISGPTQSGRVGSFQSGFGSFARTNSGPSAYDDGSASREPAQSSSRHLESEANLQFHREASGFPHGMMMHTRHASRPSLSATPSTYYQQQQASSRSQSLNPNSDEAALEAARQHLARNMASSSPAQRFNTVPTTTPAPSQLYNNRWGGEFTPGNGIGQNSPYPQETRRESLAMSINQSAANSPKTYGSARPAEPWATPAAAVDLDSLARIQRSQNQMSRLGTQSPLFDPMYSPISQNQMPEIQAHLMQQMFPYQASFQGYTMPGQQYYPPATPTTYGGRPGRNQNPFENYKATPQLLDEFKKTSKGANRKWQLRVREQVFWPQCDPY